MYYCMAYSPYKEETVRVQKYSEKATSSWNVYVITTPEWSVLLIVSRKPRTTPAIINSSAEAVSSIPEKNNICFLANIP